MHFEAKCIKMQHSRWKKTSHAHSTVFYTVRHILFDMSCVSYPSLMPVQALPVTDSARVGQKKCCWKVKRNLIWEVFLSCAYASRKRCALLFVVISHHKSHLSIFWKYDWENRQCYTLSICVMESWHAGKSLKLNGFPVLSAWMRSKRVKKTHIIFFHASVNHVWILA